METNPNDQNTTDRTDIRNTELSDTEFKINILNIFN